MFIFDINWSATTAGPSPEGNRRIELFLLGCHKAASGNPCPGCFNKRTWIVPSNAKQYKPLSAANNIIKHAPNHFLTIGGGEPLDQMNDLIKMNKKLKKHGFHILCYTWRYIDDIMDGIYGTAFKAKFEKLLEVTDGFIDGPFDYTKSCYIHKTSDGLLGSIGSSNQRLVVKDESGLMFYPILNIETVTFENNIMHITTKA